MPKQLEEPNLIGERVELRHVRSISKSLRGAKGTVTDKEGYDLTIELDEKLLLHGGGYTLKLEMAQIKWIGGNS